MIKTTAKYVFWRHLFKKYQVKIYLIFSLVIVYFLVDSSYDDVQLYLEKVHPEYLFITLCVKYLIYLILGLILLKILKPTCIEEAPSKDDQAILDNIKNKSELSSSMDELHETNVDDKRQGNEDIINAIRSKKKLESKADKLLSKYRGEQ